MTEGWGGDARKVHYCRDGKALCGRVGPGFEAKIDEFYFTADALHHPSFYCAFCLRLVRGAVDRVNPRAVVVVEEVP